VLVHAFHDPQLTPLTYVGLHPRYAGLSISSNEAVLTLSEMNTTLWVGRLLKLVSPRRSPVLLALESKGSLWLAVRGRSS